MNKEWNIDVTGPRGALTETLYEAGNDWCNANLPGIVNGPNGPSMEGAQLADRLMYQIRQAIPAALCIIGSLGSTTPGGPALVIHVEMAGEADTEGVHNKVYLGAEIVLQEATA